MKQKTAIQELIKEIESLLEQPYVNPKNALNDCINLAFAKLEKEQEQVIDAFNNGQMAEAKQEFWTKGGEYYYRKFEQ